MIRYKNIVALFQVLILVGSLLLPLLSFNPVHATGWYNASWLYRQTITIDQTKIDTADLTDFPVMVKLVDGTNWSAADALATGNDIRFTAADGTTLLKYEREIHTDAALGTSIYHVKVPTVSNTTDTVIYIYYGNAGAADGADPTNVWDANYKAVWHLTDLTTSTVDDSTSNNEDGAKAGANAPIQYTNGQIYKAQDFDENADYIDMTLDFGSAYTIEMWYYPDAPSSNYPSLGGGGTTNKYAGNIFWDNTTSKVGGVSNASNNYLYTATTVSAGAWYYTAYTVNAKVNKIYLNANAAVSSTEANNPETDGTHSFGRRDTNERYWNGRIDDIRVSNIARAAEWVKATYYSGLNTLCTYGAKEGQVPTVTTTANVTLLEETTVTYSGNITIAGGTVVTRGFQYDVDTGAPYASDVHEDGSWSTDGTAYSLGATGLTAGTLYFFRAYATNASGSGYGSESYFMTKPVEPSGFTVTAGNTQNDLAWTKGTGADKTMVRYRTDGTYPTDYTNGTEAYFNTGNSYNHAGLTNGTTYKYRMWSWTQEAGYFTWYSDSYASAEGTPSTAPSVTTVAASSVEETTAVGNGNITSLGGGANCTVRGIQYDVDSGAPYASDAHENGSYGIGAYSINLSGLAEGTLYYFRAYGTNPTGTGYGSELTFLTKPLAPTGFVATTLAGNQIQLAWTLGVGADETYIIGKLGSYPTNRADGTFSWNGAGASTTHNVGVADQQWYYLAWSKQTNGALNQLSDAPDTQATAWSSAQFGGTTKCTGRGNTWATFEVSLSGADLIKSVSIEYGRTTAYGTTTTKTGSWSNGSKIYFTVRNLNTATPYHFRSKVVNTSDTLKNSADDAFATLGSPSLFEFINTGGDGDSAAICTANWTYQTFTSDDTAHTITSIRLSLKRVGAPSTVTVSIRNGNATGDEPTGEDLLIGTLSGDTMSTSYNWYQFIPTTTVSIKANTSYVIVVRALNGDDSNYVMWQKDTGGSLADANSGISTDGGIAWTAGADDQLFELWGYPSLRVVSAKVYKTYITTNDWLIVAEVENTYPPYYNDNADPAQFFYLQLVNSVTGTVDAAVPCVMWQRSPLGIYINPTQAGSLTWGGAYNVRLYYSEGADYQEYPLSDADWSGTDLSRLDAWIRLTANSMQDYYNVALLTSDLSKGGQLILDSTGGVFFARGIPALTTVRPEMFSDVGGATAPHSEVTFNKTYEGSRSWSTSVGTDLTNLLKSWGTVLGVDTTDTDKTNTFAGILFCIAYILLLVILGADKLDGWLSIILALPFVGLGMYLGFIPMTYVFAVGLFAIGIRVFSWLSP